MTSSVTISDPVAVVLAATIPTLGTIYVAYIGRGLRSKVQETHHQVTVNTHASEQPTVLDRLADVAVIATQAREAALEAQRTALDTSSKLEEHLEWSSSETRNIWRAVWYAFRTHKERADEEHDVPEQR